MKITVEPAEYAKPLVQEAKGWIKFLDRRSGKEGAKDCAAFIEKLCIEYERVMEQVEVLRDLHEKVCKEQEQKIASMQCIEPVDVETFQGTFLRFILFLVGRNRSARKHSIKKGYSVKFPMPWL